MPELTDLQELDAAAARDWIDRWDRQQEVYMADREERFTALIDAVEAAAGRLEHGGDSLGPLGAVGRQVLPAPVLALRQQVHQRDRDPDDDIRVTVKIHLTSYFLPL